MLRTFLGACFVAIVFSSSALAQKNELSLIIGGGRLIGRNESVSASACSLGYTRSLIGGLAVEGSLDAFFAQNGTPPFRDDFGSVEASLVYHLLPVKKTRTLIPYLTAGIGKVSTDFTEIPGEKIYRFGGGIKYYLSDEHRWGMRIEVRDEITKTGGYQSYPVSGSRLSVVTVRGGISYRF